MQHQAADASLQQFKKYSVFSKVTFSTLAAPQWQQYFIVSSALRSWLIQHFGKAPEDVMETVTGDLGVVINQSQLSAQGYHLLLSEQGVTALQQFLQQHPHPELPVSVYEAICIQAGIPEICGNNINQLVPQMVNLQLLEAIDFDKGCYIGQEVIARTRYLGKNKRAALVFRWPEATNVEIGATVEKQLGEHWRSAGTVVRSATLGAETWVMAVVANDTTLAEVHRLSALPSGPTFTATALLGQ